MTDTYSLRKKNWPSCMPTQSTYPFGRVPAADYLKKHAENTPGKTAIIFYGREVSFREWDESSDRMATALADMGCRKGDALTIYMPNCPQCFIAYTAAARLGMIIFPADSVLKEYELEYHINDSASKVVFCFDQNYPVVKSIKEKTGIRHIIVSSFSDFLPAEPALPLLPIMTEAKQTFPEPMEFLDLLRKYPPNPPKVDIDMDELELVLYTGGTTGPPKGCMHTHETLLKAIVNVNQLDMPGGACGVVFAPFAHTAGAANVTSLSTSGGTLVMFTRLDPFVLLQAIEKYRIDSIILPIFKFYLAQPELLKRYDLSSMKYWVGHEWLHRLTPEDAKKWEELLGKPLVKWGYGMAELTGGPIAAGSRIGYEVPFKDPFIMGAVPPDEGGDVKIIDFDTREELPPGRQGEIVLKAPWLCKGYWKKPEETARSFTPDGWFYTEDIGMLDEEGYLYWFGRKKYIIRTSGFQVSPAEIETIGMKCSDIAKIGIIGIPHEMRGEIPLAFVELKPGSKATEAEIESWFKDHVASYKVPKVEIRQELPVTLVGKVDVGKLSKEQAEKQKG